MQELTPSVALAMLKGIVEQKKSYAQKSNSVFIKKEAEELQEIFKVFSQIKYLDIALQVEKEIERLQKQDSEMNGVIIIRRNRRGQERFGKIEIDLSHQ